MRGEVAEIRQSLWLLALAAIVMAVPVALGILLARLFG